MKKRFRRILIAIATMLMAIGFYGVSQAAESATSVAYDNEPIIVGTGLKTAVYSQMMQTPIALSGKLMVESTGSTGGIDNVMALLQRKIDAGIVQADVLEFMRRTEPMVTKKVRSLIGLHTNHLHIFVLRSGLDVKKNLFQSQRVYVRNLRDLRGCPVAAFSSAPITARIINERLGLGMKIYEVSTKEEGFRMLQEGKVYAFLATGGKYIPWVEKDVDGSRITLANTNPSDIQQLGQPYLQAKVTYRKLGVVGVNVVGVKNELVCWDFTGRRSAQLLEIRNFIKQNLTEIQETRGSHPAWQEIDQNTLDEVSWQKYQPGR